MKMILNSLFSISLHLGNLSEDLNLIKDKINQRMIKIYNEFPMKIKKKKKKNRFGL